MTQTKPRAKRIHIQTSDNPYPMEMIQHGYQAMELLNLFGGLTSWQMCKLLFLNRPNSQGQVRSEPAARKATNLYCLRRLKDLGLVKVKPIAIPENPPAKWEINYLTKTGYETLQHHHQNHDQATLPYRPPSLITHQTINHHSMGTRDAGISAVVGAWHNHMQVVTYLDDSQVRSLSKQGQLKWPMEPDFVLVLRYGQVRRVLFGEVDRGTESGKSTARNSWQSKMDKYKLYFQALRKDDSWFKDYPQPDVMIVTPSDRRLDNLKAVTGDRGGKSAYWFTTAELIEPPYSFFDQVWQRIALPGYYSPTERFAS